MSRDDLRPISYTLMALVGEHGASAHDLARLVREGAPLFFHAAPSYVYREPVRLEQMGYLDARTEPGKTRSKTVYTLTSRGRDALREWLAEPASFPRIQHEASLRLLAGDLIPDADIVASLVAMRAQLDDLEQTVGTWRGRLETVPHRARYLELNYRLASALLEAHRDWIDAAERELGQTGPGPGMSAADA